MHLNKERSSLVIDRLVEYLGVSLHQSIRYHAEIVGWSWRKAGQTNEAPGRCGGRSPGNVDPQIPG